MKRRLKFLLENIFFILIIIIIAELFFTNINACKYIQTRTVTVLPGETIWDIASNYYNGDLNIDIQEVIYDIQEINSISGNNLEIGQEICLPIYE